MFAVKFRLLKKSILRVIIHMFTYFLWFLCKMLFIFRKLTLRSSYGYLLCIYLVVAMTFIYFLWPKTTEEDIFSQNILKIRKQLGIEMMCHYKKAKDAVPVVNKRTKFPNNSIFFIEASCSGLNSRQACSVESAARANPKLQVNLLFTSAITWNDYKHSILTKFTVIHNINPMRIDVETYAEGTPLHKRMKDMNSRNKLTMNLIDILKFLTIYKYPGIYLSLDVIVSRPFSGLNANWIVMETPGTISSDIFSFSYNRHGRALADTAMDILVKDANLPEQSLWSFDNPNLMKKLIFSWCGITNLVSLTSAGCPGLQVLPPEKFFPISFYQRHAYFEPNYDKKWRDENIFGYQIWERFTKYNIINNNSFFMELAREYCPITYQYFKNDFGFV